MALFQNARYISVYQALCGELTNKFVSSICKNGPVSGPSSSNPQVHPRAGPLFFPIILLLSQSSLRKPLNLQACCEEKQVPSNYLWRHALVVSASPTRPLLRRRRITPWGHRLARHDPIAASSLNACFRRSLHRVQWDEKVAQKVAWDVIACCSLVWAWRRCDEFSFVTLATGEWAAEHDSRRREGALQGIAGDHKKIFAFREHGYQLILSSIPHHTPTHPRPLLAVSYWY